MTFSSISASVRCGLKLTIVVLYSFVPNLAILSDKEVLFMFHFFTIYTGRKAPSNHHSVRFRFVSFRFVSFRFVSFRSSFRFVSSSSRRLVSSRLVSSRLVASRRVASRRVASRVASRRVASRRVASRRVASRRVASRRVASRRVAQIRIQSNKSKCLAHCNRAHKSNENTSCRITQWDRQV